MATTARFTNNVGVFNQGTDNTDIIRNNDYLQPVYAATITVNPSASYTLLKPGTLTGALTLNLGVGGAGVAPFVGDRIDVLFTPDGTTRTVTFGTGISPTVATQAVTTAKLASVSFMFNGTTWLEIGRSISA